MNEEFLRSTVLLFSLLNPFLMSIYLLDLIQGLDAFQFFKVLARGALISTVVFIVFAWAGEAVFRDVLQVSFASFQVFGGLIFVVIGIRFVFSGPDAIRDIRGAPEHLAGSIAMPFMIGPGTLSASVVIGKRLPISLATGSILVTIACTVITVTGVKLLHDAVRRRSARLIERYVDIIGRLSALLIGTIAVEMIFLGIRGWLAKEAGAAG